MSHGKLFIIVDKISLGVTLVPYEEVARRVDGLQSKENIKMLSWILLKPLRKCFQQEACIQSGVKYFLNDKAALHSVWGINEGLKQKDNCANKI